MEDEVKLLLSYRCTIRDKTATLPFFPPAEPAADAPPAKGKGKAAAAADAPPPEWQCDPETGWSVSLRVPPLVKGGAEMKPPECKALERFDLGEGAGTCAATPLPVEDPPPPPPAPAAEEDPPPPRPAPVMKANRDRVFVLSGEAEQTLTVNAALVRTMAGARGECPVHFTVHRLKQSAAQAEAPEGEEPPPPPVEVDKERGDKGDIKFDVVLDLADLLAQEPRVVQTVPAKHGAVPAEIAAACPEIASIELSVTVVQPEPKPAPEAAAEGDQGPAVTGGAEGDDTPADGGPDAPQHAPGAPRPLLPLGLARMYNPMVLRVVSVKDLPDLPATRQQLDELCDRVEVRFRLPMVEEPFAFKGEAGPWRDPGMPGEPSRRTVAFDGARVVMLLGELDVDRLQSQARTEVVQFSVFDRVVVVEEPDVVVPPPEHRVEVELAEEEAEEAEEVFGSAQWPLSDLSKRTRVWTRLNVLPGTNLRAAAGLDWKTRPGRYLEAESYLKLDVKTAVKIPETTGAPHRRPFQRAVFVMDHRDTELLHRLERTIKVLNAITLGMVEHPVADPAEPDLGPMPEEPKDEDGEEEEEPAKDASVSRRKAASVKAQKFKDEHDAWREAVEERRRLMDEYEEAVQLAKAERLTHRYDLEDVSSHTLVVMSTKKMTQEEAEDPSLNLLTACQVIDSQQRLLLVEGLADGWMRQIMHLCEVALVEQAPDHCKRPRRALWSPLLTYDERVLQHYGIHAEQVKLRAPIPDLVSEAGSFSTGRVRDLCREGVRRLHAVARADFTRLVEDLRLFPSGAMIDLVYKKFGGELTKEDVLGWTEPKKNRHRGTRAGSRASRASRATGMSRISGQPSKAGTIYSQAETSSKGAAGAPEPLDDEDEDSDFSDEDPARKPYVRPWNELYLAEVERRARERAGIDWEVVNDEERRELGETLGRELRERWETWNPQRQALEEVLAAEDPHATARQMMEEWEAKQAPLPIPGTISAAEAKALNWCPHGAPFRWPAPKDPQSFRAHPKKPSDARAEDLHEPWEEGKAMGELPPREGIDLIKEGKVPFVNMIQTGGVLEKDPGYFKSVHLTGAGLAKEMAEAKRREREEFARKVVVDDVTFRAVVPTRDHVSDLDRNAPWLVDKPQKLVHKTMRPKVRPAPISMHLEEPWNPGDKDVLLRKPKPDKWLNGPETDFLTKKPETGKVYHFGATQKLKATERERDS